MQDISTLVSGIDFKVRTLCSKYKEERQKNVLLNKKNAELFRLVEEQKEALKFLEETNKVLKLGNAVANSSDSKEVKLKINELVREIDKCIGLLTQAG